MKRTFDLRLRPVEMGLRSESVMMGQNGRLTSQTCSEGNCPLGLLDEGSSGLRRRRWGWLLFHGGGLERTVVVGHDDQCSGMMIAEDQQQSVVV